MAANKQRQHHSTTWTCYSCGSVNSDHDVLCKSCGTRGGQ